ncbi:hypothetical protein [Chitinolyticbacter meiyuanensis]|uniref:hypothetical protein n=1 Tax=Chitinolyticbacter meiyuanensis TaxID=682798 RepID=UPI0011E5A09A|nr:hypothetical protein [Chitinolyticbacter meiyuanensis]
MSLAKHRSSSFLYAIARAVGRWTAVLVYPAHRTGAFMQANRLACRDTAPTGTDFQIAAPHSLRVTAKTFATGRTFNAPNLYCIATFSAGIPDFSFSRRHRILLHHNKAPQTRYFYHFYFHTQRYSANKTSINLTKLTQYEQHINMKTTINKLFTNQQLK